MANELYVLGAGASKAARETPLGNELLWNYIAGTNFMTKVQDDGSADNRMDDNKNSTFVQFLEKIETHFPTQKGIVEKFLKRDFEFFMPDIRDKELFADELLRFALRKGDLDFYEIIKRLIYQHLNESHSVMLQPKYDLYEEFAKYLILQSESNVISMNFDTLLYSVSLKGKNYIFDYGFKVGEDHRTIPIDSIAYICKMIKLHGSFDWKYCYKCNKMTLSSPHQRYYDYESERCYSCKTALKPYFIVPFDKKLIEYEKMLFDQAKELISNAQKIHIIGYSFPEYDQDVITLLKNAVNPRSEIIIVDKATESHRNTIMNKMGKIIPNTRISLYLDGFEKYFTEVLSS